MEEMKVNPHADEANPNQAIPERAMEMKEDSLAEKYKLYE